METRSLDELNKDLPSSGTPYSHRNKIINGGFDIWQRGVSFTNPVDYTADRWITRPSAHVGGTVTVSRNITSIGSIYMKVLFAGATDPWYIRQFNERPQLLSGKTVTFSFKTHGWDNASDLIFGVYLNTTVDGEDNLISPDNLLMPVTAGSTNEVISITFDIIDLSGYTIDGNSSYFFQLGIDSAPADGSFRFTEVQLEEGSVVTPFEQRPIAYELSLCQRYFQHNISTSTSIYVCGGDTYHDTSSVSVPLIVEMRTHPTVVILSGGLVGHHANPPTLTLNDYKTLVFTWSGTNSRSEHGSILGNVVWTASAEI